MNSGGRHREDDSSTSKWVRGWGRLNYEAGYRVSGCGVDAYSSGSCPPCPVQRPPIHRVQYEAQAAPLVLLAIQRHGELLE